MAEETTDQNGTTGQNVNIVHDETTTTTTTETHTLSGDVNMQQMSNDAWEQMKKIFTDGVVDMVDQLFDFSSGGSDESQLDSTDSTSGSCSKKVVGVDEYQTSDGQCHKSPDTPKYKQEIEKNDIPENWWDNLPDFDPRVYDAIAMEQASACVEYIFGQDVHELENKMEARKFRKTDSRTKVQVPRTHVKKPEEIRYDTKIDDFIKKDQTY